MSNDYPRMLYKFPGNEPMHGGLFATKIVADEDEQDAALADGWNLSTPEAKEAHAKAQKPAAVEVKQEAAQEPIQTAAAAPPAAEDHGAEHAAERTELKAKAAALGLVYPRNVTNEKLAELIAAAPPAAEG